MVNSMHSVNPNQACTLVGTNLSCRIEGFHIGCFLVEKLIGYCAAHLKPHSHMYDHCVNETWAMVRLTHVG